LRENIPAFEPLNPEPLNPEPLNLFNGVPDKETAQKVYDNLDLQRSVQAYLNSIQIASMHGMRKGLLEFGPANTTALLFENLMDSKALWLTPNTTSIYMISWLEMKDEPMVMETPPKMLGILDDMAFHYMTDLGVAGPDKGKGGKFLVLPPGYKSDVPDGYFVVPSKTYGVWLFMRGYLDKGIKDASDNIRNNLKVYPLARASKPPKTEFINASGVEMNGILPNDFSFYESLNAIIQEEPLEFLDPETRGQIASIGIVQGKPFNPDARMRRILTEAVAIGNAYARANTILPRDPGQRIYKGTDSEWLMAYPDKDTYFLTDGARRFEGRLWMHYNAICVTPAMAVTKPGKGSDYGIAGLDSEHRPLDGSKTYKLHLPPNVPVKDNWSVTIYDYQTRSMLQTDQQYAGINSLGKGLKKNADGSFDIYFAPKAPKGMENKWIQTIPGKSWFIILRMYGPLEPRLDQTWRPGEIELVE
jgi:hypothetical protein